MNLISELQSQFSSNQKKSFFEKIGLSFKILKTSIRFVHQDKSLLLVPIISLLSKTAVLAIFILLVMSGSILLAIIGTIILLVLGGIWQNFLAATQSWMVYEVALDQDATLISGISRALKNSLDIIGFTFASFALGFITGKNKQGFDVMDVARQAQKVAQKLVLPAMIVTEKNLWAAAKDLKKALSRWAELAVFELGIKPITGTLWLITFIISGLLGLIVGPISGIILLVLLGMTLSAATNLINQIFYTLVYITLIEGKDVKGISS